MLAKAPKRTKGMLLHYIRVPAMDWKEMMRSQVNPSTIEIDPTSTIGDVCMKLQKKHKCNGVTPYKPLKSKAPLIRDVYTLLKDNDIDNLATKLHLDTPAEPLVHDKYRLIFVFHDHRDATPESSEEVGADTKAEVRGGDTFTAMEQTFRRHTESILSKPSLTSASKYTQYNTIQASPAALLDGRISNRNLKPTVAPPIELYHYAFHDYIANTDTISLDLPNEVILGTRKLMGSVSVIQTREEPRDTDTRKILSDILQITLSTVQNSDKSSCDYLTIVGTPKHEEGALAFMEVKPKYSSSNVDPSVQVGFSYSRHYCQPNRQALLQRSCCPSFLIAIAGPWLVIMGGVITTQTIVQRLSPYLWLGTSRIQNGEYVISIAQKLFALRKAIAELNKYYRELAGTGNAIEPACFFPYITSFDKHNNKVKFEYLKPLEDDPTCVTFLAKRPGTSAKFVVKFTRRYNAEAHESMAKKGFAPQLIHYGSLYGGLNLVVMDYIEGATLSTLYPPASHRTKEAYKDAISKALKALHEDGFIFPDLRQPNVMFAAKGGTKVECVRLIDFDWVCKEADKARYPIYLSTAICQAAQTEPYGLITEANEARMFEVMFEGL
ncbi:hypothetical protein WG66_005673 [Moniliophthora roreri]|uniref:Protein kinase domain-containing protein n=1 Tax=Moniliophthora roreri TaxID=221103 RepID=A0A0W0FMN9_MONRR|nr:hypothetical protein WG66_005673 [Moniliophthora roreri]